MVALVKFSADQTKKYLRITDLYPVKPVPKTSGLLAVGEIFPVVVETFDQDSGLVKVEVSSDGKTFSTHEKRKLVAHGNPYPI